MDNPGSKQQSCSLFLETKRPGRRWLYAHGQALAGRGLTFATTLEIGRVNCEARAAPEIAARRAGSLLAARRGGSCLQNGRGSGEDAGRTLIRNFLFGF